MSEDAELYLRGRRLGPEDLPAYVALDSRMPMPRDLLLEQGTVFVAAEAPEPVVVTAIRNTLDQDNERVAAAQYAFPTCTWKVYKTIPPHPFMEAGMLAPRGHVHVPTQVELCESGSWTTLQVHGLVCDTDSESESDPCRPPPGTTTLDLAAFVPADVSKVLEFDLLEVLASGAVTNVLADTDLFVYDLTHVPGWKTDVVVSVGDAEGPMPEAMMGVLDPWTSTWTASPLPCCGMWTTNATLLLPREPAGPVTVHGALAFDKPLRRRLALCEPVLRLGPCGAMEDLVSRRRFLPKNDTRRYIVLPPGLEWQHRPEPELEPFTFHTSRT